MNRLAYRARTVHINSKKPEAGARQRWARRGLRNAGFWATVSARALIIRLLILGSLAQDGISHQRIRASYPDWSMMGEGCEGATGRASPAPRGTGRTAASV